MTATDAPRPRPPAPRLTPERVRTMQFTRTPLGRRGLAEEEVQQFLQRVAEDIASRDADDASMRATISHYKSTLAHWQSEHGDYRDEAAMQRPTIEAVNILSRAQQEADSYVAQTQAYCRRIAVDARQHAQEILAEAQYQAEEAAQRAVEEYQAAAAARAAADTDTGDNPQSLELEDLERRLVWVRTFLASLETVEAQLRSTREALSFEVDRIDTATSTDPATSGPATRAPTTPPPASASRSGSKPAHGPPPPPPGNPGSAIPTATPTPSAFAPHPD
jgi:DivIVA domain-containing protein